MIRIRYSSDPLEAIDLEGSNLELLDLHDKIIAHRKGSLLIEADLQFDPTPYEKCIGVMKFQISDSLLNIEVSILRINVETLERNLVSLPTG